MSYGSGIHIIKTYPVGFYKGHINRTEVVMQNLADLGTARDYLQKFQMPYRKKGLKVEDIKNGFRVVEKRIWYQIRGV
jgi:hypothetical protein